MVYATGEDETDFGAAARVYWTLKYLGFEHISILNGGFKYWQANADSNVEQAARKLPASRTLINLQPQLAVGTDELLDKISRQSSNYQLLDSRPAAFFQGAAKAPTASVGGTIAGAESLPFQQWFNDNDTRIRPIAEIRQLVEQQQLTGADETLSFCNTGHWAATNWFVLSELAGVDNVRLYPGSMAEWTQSPVALPMDNAPTRWQQVKAKFQQLVQ
jgi:thiosulfate/3-mercaptopyruvate sulfurtransferase